MYCDAIQRWIPVQLSWIRGLSEDYYTIHFTVLFQQFLLHSILPEEREKLATSIVDFSKAQQKGFVAAYMNVFGKTDANEAMKKLKGCREHFRQSVTRVKRNRAIIRVDEEGAFQSLCIGLLEPTIPPGPTHEDKIDELRRRFPKTRRWLDWWTMADVEALLFPSRRAMLEDHPDGDDGLPSSTNAQESLHRVYYMFSPGKKTMLKGMVQLYAFLKALERDYALTMRGIPIRYGSQLKKQVDVSQSLGWTKPTKRQQAATKENQAKNDGRPPDTTDLLLGESQGRAKKSNTGRPPNSVNIDRNRHTTYASYAASKVKQLSNRCWLSAALESLYAVFSPLWLAESGGKPTDIFNLVVNHFSTRSTHEMKESTSLGKVLTAGSKSLFDAIEELRPNSFKPGRFASCDLFIESVLDPSKNKCRVLRTLFSVNEHRVFTCALHHSQVDHSRGNQLLTVLRITNLMFDSNSISRTNPAELITLWSTNGLTGQSGLHCRDCLAEPKKKRTRKTKKIEPESLVEPQTLEQLSVIRTPEDAKPPAHLHFHIETATLLEEEDQKKFMSEMNWPFKITVFGEEYTLISRGFFGYSHYWGKVLRYANGLMGVWRHDDQLNAGRAYMLDPIPGSISGAQDDTSWLIYSRCWTPEEAAFVNKGTGQILKDNPQFPNNIPFTRMHSILTVAYNGELAHNPSAGAAP